MKTKNKKVKPRTIDQALLKPPKEALRLRKFREEAEIPSTEQCSKRLGWCLNRWLRYENGSRSLSMDSLDEIAKEFKISPTLFVMYIYQDRYPLFAKFIQKRWKSPAPKRK